VNAGGGI